MPIFSIWLSANFYPPASSAPLYKRPPNMEGGREGGRLKANTHFNTLRNVMPVNWIFLNCCSWWQLSTWGSHQPPRHNSQTPPVHQKATSSEHWTGSWSSSLIFYTCTLCTDHSKDSCCIHFKSSELCFDCFFFMYRTFCWLLYYIIIVII